MLKKYYMLFLCTNIFFPKLNLGFGNFYFFEFINIGLFALLIGSGKLRMNSIAKSYALFIAISFLSFFVGVMSFKLFDSQSFARLLKFSFFIFYLIIPFYILKYVSIKDLFKVINYQIIFFIAAGAYVLYNVLIDPISVHDSIWGYDNKYRLIGLTGYGIGLDGSIERLFGTTSVSMGVFIAFIFLIYLAFYRADRSRKLLFTLLLLTGLELLTYSRTGLIVMVTGLFYYFILNLKPGLIFKVTFLSFLLLGALLVFDALDQISTLGTVAKLTDLSALEDPRVEMLFAGLTYLWHHPLAILFGSGFGELYTLKAVGYPHLEGLIPTMLVTSGIVAVFLLCLHFFLLWRACKQHTKEKNNDYQTFLYGIRLFVPGWFISSTISGNTFQTDFYFPIVYFIFMISYLKTKELDH
jgi:hypothetical protein